MRRVALFVRGASLDEQGVTPLSFDGDVVLIGRGEKGDPAVDLALPHRSVSGHHATLRLQGEHCTLTDEGSRNGTFVGQVQLAPLMPRLVRAGDLLRLGNVWLELQFLSVEERPKAPTTRDLALAMVSREVKALRGPQVVVVEGPDFGAELAIEAPGSLTIGRGADQALPLHDPEVRANHLSITQRGTEFALSGRHFFALGSNRIAPGTEVTWPPRLMVRLGGTVLALEVPAEREKVAFTSVPSLEAASEHLAAAVETEQVAPEVSAPSSVAAAAPVVAPLAPIANVVIASVAPSRSTDKWLRVALFSGAIVACVTLMLMLLWLLVALFRAG